MSLPACEATDYSAKATALPGQSCRSPFPFIAESDQPTLLVKSLSVDRLPRMRRVPHDEIVPGLKQVFDVFTLYVDFFQRLFACGIRAEAHAVVLSFLAERLYPAL